VAAGRAIGQGKANALRGEGSEDAGVLHIVGWVVDVLSESLSSGCKGATEHGFMNKVDAKLKGVATHDMAEVVADLVFVLVAEVGEKRDGSGKLVVAKGFKAGDGQCGGTEGK